MDERQLHFSLQQKKCLETSLFLSSLNNLSSQESIKTTHFLWHLLQIRVFLAPLSFTSKAAATFTGISCLAAPSPATSASTFLATDIVELQRVSSAYLY